MINWHSRGKARLSGANRVYEEVGEVGLHTRVQMDLGLFEDYDGTTRNIEALDNHGENLAHAEANVGQLDLGQCGTGLDEDLVLLSVLAEGLHVEFVDEAHHLESLCDELRKWLQGLLLRLAG